MACLAQVAVGKLPELAVFGNDYPTPDGTGVRDYIHVVDLAEGHLCALRALQGPPGLQGPTAHTGAHVWNLGTGQGYSVLEMVRAFEAASGRPIPYRLAPRRPGDIATCYSDPTKAERELGWKAQRGLAEMMRDAWRWQQMSPGGMGGSAWGARWRPCRPRDVEQKAALGRLSAFGAHLRVFRRFGRRKTTWATIDGAR